MGTKKVHYILCKLGRPRLACAGAQADLNHPSLHQQSMDHDESLQEKKGNYNETMWLYRLVGIPNDRTLHKGPFLGVHHIFRCLYFRCLLLLVSVMKVIDRNKSVHQ